MFVMKTAPTIGRALIRLACGRTSGQALLEFVFIALLMVSLLFALIDFGRAIYDRQVLINLSREGASLACRGTDFTNTVDALLQSDAPLDLSTKGRIIVSALVNSNGTVTVGDQYRSDGGIDVSSRIGQVGDTAQLPNNPVLVIPQPYQTLYAVEVFYSFRPVTPIGRMLRFTLPSQLYDVAYF
jgi:hypothetical protein